MSAYQRPPKGCWTRTVATLDLDGEVRLEVRDLIVGPNQSASDTTLPGPAIVEILSGGGQFMIAKESRELKAGATFMLAEGASFDVENAADLGITMRAQVFVAR